MTTEENDHIPATASAVRFLAAELKLSEQAFERCIQLAGLRPNKSDWLEFLDRTLLIAGSALFIVGLVAFFAFNWAELGRFAKFALLQGGLVAAVGWAWHAKLDSPSARSALLGAGVLTGVLFAVYGQTYQTGADPYGLFFVWAVLIAGWALIGRQPGLWLLVLVLLNVTLILYWEQIVRPENFLSEFGRMVFGPLLALGLALYDSELAQLVFALNAASLTLWEYFSNRGAAWMRSRWFPRVTALFALTAVTVNTLIFIFAAGIDEVRGLPSVTPLLFAAFIAVALWYYRMRCRDLFILALSLLSVIVVVTSFIGKTSHAGIDMFFVLSLLVIGQTTAATLWLRHIQRTWGQTA